MRRLFLTGVGLSAAVALVHLILDLRNYMPDFTARLSVSLAYFMLLLGVIYLLVRKEETNN